MVSGEFTGELSNYTFDNTYCSYPSSISIGSNVVVVAYIANNNTIIRSLAIDGDGVVTHSIDSRVLAAPKGRYSTDIVHIYGDVYAFVFTNDGFDGLIATVHISDAGIISNIIQTFTYNSTRGTFPSVVHIHDDVYGISYMGSGDDGYLTTVRITNTGVISSIQTRHFGTTNMNHPSIAHVHDDVYSIVYSNPSFDRGVIRSIHIANNGTIGADIGTPYSFIIEHCFYPIIRHVHGNVYAVAYTKYYSKYCVAKTIKINDDGSYGGDVDTYNIDLSESPATDTNFIHCGSDIFAVAWRYLGGPDDTRGDMATISIDNNGNISFVDSWRFNPAYTQHPNICHIQDDLYTVAFTASAQPGRIKSFGIDTPPDVIISRHQQFTGGMMHRAMR